MGDVVTSGGAFRTGRFVLACLVAGAAWIVAEVGGGLFFLLFGVRLWRYEIVPLFFEITSPVVWMLAFLLIVPLSHVFDLAFGKQRPKRTRLLAYLAFLMVTGPVVEVILNEHFFRPLFGRALYQYLVLPTFEGSGSLLSPLYYATLVLHRPLTERLTGTNSSFPRPA
jgi:hypothetical protein